VLPASCRKAKIKGGLGAGMPTILVVFAQRDLEKITKRTHFEFSNRPINTGDFEPSASIRRKKRTHFGKPRHHKNIAFYPSGASKISMQWQMKAIQLRRANR
jgi:hypothetical protein